MDDDAGAFDVLEELDSEAVSEVRAFDESGEIGYGEGFGVGKVADLDYAEVGLERGEGVVGDLRLGGGEARDKGRRADIGIADEASVCEETEFEAVGAFFAGATELVLARGLVGAGGEVLVASAAPTAFGYDDGFIGPGEVVDELAGGVVVEEGAYGNFEGCTFARVSGAVGAEAVASALGFVLGVEAEVDQGVVAEGGGHEDVAPVTAISAGGTALGNELFAAKGHAAVATVTGFDTDSCFINKHFNFQCTRMWVKLRIQHADCAQTVSLAAVTHSPKQLKV